jgi:Ca2+-binding EF-hand superfamily protein
MRVLTIVMTGSLLILGTNALAEDTVEKAGCGHAGRHGGGHRGMWKQFDKDGDGTLSDAEKTEMKAAWAARHDERKKKMLAKFDEDGDGTLSDAEKTNAKAAWAARHEVHKKQMLAKFDKDGDGTLSAEEKTNAKKSGASEMRKKMFSALDTSGDGKLSTTEIQTKMEQMRGKCGGHKAFGSNLTEEEKAAMKSISEKWINEMVGKFDADGDGQVAEKELAAGMATLRGHCKKGHAQPEEEKEVLKLR